jgi:acetate kinase
MKILTINTGSSSVRMTLFTNEPEGLIQTTERHHSSDNETPEQLLVSFLNDQIKDITAVSHRIVHGGTEFADSCFIDEHTEKEIERLIPLAPLHNPVALRWIQACRTILGGNIPQIAVFDTAFYTSLPEVAKTYAIPKDLCHQYGIYRYGFHGLAHRAMLQRWQRLNPALKQGGKVISLQLGSGCSVTAIKEGKPIDTSMGFSPLEGLMMSTRCGDLDPGVLIYLQKSTGLSIDGLDKLLNKSSGLLGVSGISGDMQVLLNSNIPEARLAIALYCYRAKKYIGAYMAALGGADVILFGGGVGENSPIIRAQILQEMQWCGIELDTYVNNSTIGEEARISSTSSKVDIWVIPVDESYILAEEAITLLQT